MLRDVTARMSGRGVRPALAGVLMAAIVAGIAPPSSGETASDEPVRAPGPPPIVIEPIDDSVDVNDPELIEAMLEINEEFEPGVTRYATEPVVSWPMAAVSSSGIQVQFDSTYTAPSNVQAVVLAAAARWDEALATTSSGPVVIAVQWRALGPGVLGSAGPNGLYTSGHLPSSSFYPVGLVNTRLNQDLNGASPEVLVNLSSTPNWYISTSGSPGGQLDLYSVVLHEIGHGLGFIGSADDGGGSPALNSTPFVFDELVRHNGQPLLGLSNRNDLLESGPLHIHTSSAWTEKVFAPASWQEGSSFSHFDESDNPPGTPGSLMTPSIGSGQVERHLDGSVLGVMAGIGWPMRVGAITPQLTSVTPGNGLVSATWDLPMGAVGLAPDGFRVEAWRNGTVLDGSVAVSGTATSATVYGLHGGVSYKVKVIPHARGVDGTYAYEMVITPGVPGRPAVVKLEGSGLNRTVTWTSLPGVSHYDVERSADGVTWSTVGSTSGTSMAVSLTEGIHQFRVRGHNSHGAGHWGNSIPTGVSAGVARPVELDSQLVRLYRAYFLRDPDPAGFGHWQAQRAAGVSLNDISAAFAGSNEFVNGYGHLSNEQFVDLVYQNVLGRAADAAGRSYWSTQLAGGVSRGRVMTGFSESSEFVVQTGTTPPRSVTDNEVYRLYVAFFLRFPDGDGWGYWSGVRRGGASLEAIANEFVGSTEFVTTYGSLPDEQFVDLVYQNVLGRSADSGGRSYWVGQLGSGVSRAQMMVAFSESPEFTIATGTIR